MAAAEAADIVVVGAGVAGLYAAHLLRSTVPELKTIVLEAGARHGGRILTMENFAPWPVDLGGEFVHGEDTLHYNFCKKHALALQRSFCSFPPTGGREAYFHDRPVHEYFYLPLERRLISWVDAQERESSVPHLSHMLSELENIEFGADTETSSMGDLHSYLVGRGVHQSMLSLADSILAKTWSTDLHNLDLAECALESAKEHFQPGPNNFILERGQKQMLDVMGDGIDIRYRSKVASIEKRSEDTGHLLCTEDGHEFQAKWVLVAAPVTAYRPGTGLRFTPPIPKLESAATACFEGWAIKILVSFKARFWDPAMLLVFCADSVVSQIWADPPRPIHYNGATEDCHTLTGFITGSQAKAAAAWESWMIVDAFLKQLDAMFCSKDIPRPASDTKDDHIICNWLTYKDICASYTSPTKGSSARMSAFAALHHDGALACCGEHVPYGDHYEIGTINGAMESAQAAVERWFPDALPAEFRDMSSKPRL